MKIVTWASPDAGAGGEIDEAGRAGLLHGDLVLDLEALGGWAARNGAGAGAGAARYDAGAAAARAGGHGGGA